MHFGSFLLDPYRKSNRSQAYLEAFSLLALASRGQVYRLKNGRQSCHNHLWVAAGQINNDS
jgi:hypothetical protein